MILADSVRETPSPCKDCTRTPSSSCHCRPWTLWYKVMWADIRYTAGKGAKLKAVGENGEMYYEEDGHE